MTIGSHPGLRVRNSGCVTKLSGTGLERGALCIERPLAASTGTGSRLTMPVTVNERVSSTPACPRVSRKLTLTGRSRISLNGFPVTESYPTSAAESTSRGLAFGPFWTPACAALSAKSWLPTGTGSPVSAQDLSNTSSAGTDRFLRSLKIEAAPDVPKSLQTTSWRCSPTSLPACTERVRTATFNVRLLPDKDQREVFNTFYGANRFFFNRSKVVCDKVDGEAVEARVAELVRDHDD